MIKLYFSLILSLLFSNNILASSLDANIFHNEKQNNKINLIFHTENNKLINATTKSLDINKRIIYAYLDTINIHVWQQSSKAESFSNALKDKCEIDISYDQNLTPFLLNDINKDILFITTHEIAHCILGKEVLDKPIDWHYNISEKQKVELNSIIEKKTNTNISLLKKNKRIVLPMIVYHEMFADTFATLWLLSIDKLKPDDIKEIIKERELQYQIKNQETSYLSFLPLKNILNLLENDKFIFKNMKYEDIYGNSLLIVQKSFIEYLIK